MRAPTSCARTTVLLFLVCLGGTRSSQAVTYTVSGVVKNEAGQGLGGVDLAFVEYCSDAPIFLPNHTTIANGSFSIVVNENTYDIEFSPAAGSTLAGSNTGDLAIHANLNLGTIVLHPGIKIAGTVRNQAGTGLTGINLDLVNVATGNKIFVANDVTGTGGTYSVRVPPGTYDAEYRPASTTTYVTGLRKGLVATADVTGLIDTLVPGVKVFGHVQDQNAANVVNADLNFYDTCQGFTIPTAHDNSDSLGNFAVYVPAGTYTISFAPPRCTTLGAARIASLPVAADTDLGPNELPDAFPVSGRILDPMGQPVADADLKFYDVSSGARQASAHSHTDALGTFSSYVPPGDYNLNILPPPAKDLLVGRIPVTVAGATPVGDVTLLAGLRIAGSVLGPGGAGVRNANVNVLDSATRASVRLANDNTAEDGSFGVIVPPGTYDFQYLPPACSPLAQGDQKRVAVGSGMALPAIHLVPGVHARGNVVDALGFAVTNVDLDFFPAGTRDKSYTPNDNTSGSGAYDVFIAPGIYDIDYTPPSGNPLRAVQRFSVVLSSDTTLPNTVLHRGFFVSGSVLESSTSLPVAGAVLAFYPPGGGSPLFTPRNSSDSSGAYSVLVDSGTWDILYSPPPGSGLAPRWRRGVVVSSNTALPSTLLLPLAVPTVGSITPSSGTTRGGQAITITGSGFQPDATVEIGGVSAKNVVFVSSMSLTASTPAHPAGPASEVVKNPGNQIGVGPAAYTFTEPAGAVSLTVTRSGNNVLLSWSSTGQAAYTVFRSGSPGVWSDASVLTTTPGTSYTDVGSSPVPGTCFYNVD